MDIDALLEAFQDFEKKAKKEPCPVLEQFLCHVAKTGQPLLSWSQFKNYFLFKLESVMDDFHASAPEQRGLHNPNVEYVTFEEMKTRILKIVDGYNGIPFTIQRLCELLTDPKRNYTGTDKFLRGLEKNVMVVSCVYPASEKNGASSVNRMNGVMFSGNSSYSESRNVNGPGTLKTLCRPKLSLSSSLSTNGLPDCPVSKEPEPSTEEEEEQEQHHISGSEPSQSDGETTPSSGIKNKHTEEEEEEDSDGDKQEVKRLKFDKKEEDEAAREEEESSSRGMSETPEPSKDSRGQDDECETSCDTPEVSDNHETSSTKTDPLDEGEEEDSCEAAAAHCPKSDGTADQSDQPASLEKRTGFEQDSGDNSNSSSSSSSSSGSSSDGGSPSSDKQTPSSSNSPDSSTEGGADISNSAETAIEPGEHD